MFSKVCLCGGAYKCIVSGVQKESLVVGVAGSCKPHNMGAES